MRHPNLAGKSDSLLVIVDMQETLLRAVLNRQEITSNCKKLAGTAKILNLPVLVTEQNPEKLLGTAAEILEILPPHNMVGKLDFSCCGSQDFIRHLEATGRKTVILCGVEAHICVSQTAHDLIARGYRVHVPEDAVSSRRELDRQAGIKKMQLAGAIPTSAEAVIYELLGCAGTDQFRQVLKMVK
ncbi:MAG TPA: hydrolase [Armatimonadetes bacterium]|jgi:nicotinamidase-related amidase|nr:hydrolase [Armatimonadota bacterium]